MKDFSNLTPKLAAITQTFYDCWRYLKLEGLTKERYINYHLKLVFNNKLSKNLKNTPHKFTSNLQLRSGSCSEIAVNLRCSLKVVIYFKKKYAQM